MAQRHAEHLSRGGPWVLPGSPGWLILKPMQQAQGKLTSWVQSGGELNPKAVEKGSKRNQALQPMEQKSMQRKGGDKQRDSKRK